VIRYTVLRLLVFVVFLLVLLLIGVPEIWALVFAALFSMVTSYFLLQRQRMELAQQLDERITRRRDQRQAKIARERTDEDEEDAEVEGGG
jgi:uncharacterized membrane protein YccC